MVRESKDFAHTSISRQSAKVTIVSDLSDKKYTKKLLVVMTVMALRTMCMKLFKAPDLNSVALMYEADDMTYPLDDEMRQLSYYGIADGGVVRVIFI